jgi:hypothetical protein
VARSLDDPPRSSHLVILQYQRGFSTRSPRVAVVSVGAPPEGWPRHTDRARPLAARPCSVCGGELLQPMREPLPSLGGDDERRSVSVLTSSSTRTKPTRLCHRVAKTSSVSVSPHGQAAGCAPESEQHQAGRPPRRPVGAAEQQKSQDLPRRREGEPVVRISHTPAPQAGPPCRHPGEPPTPQRPSPCPARSRYPRPHKRLTIRPPEAKPSRRILNRADPAPRSR